MPTAVPFTAGRAACICARVGGGLRMLTHFCPFPGPLPPPHPLHAVPGGLQPARPFTTRVSLGLPGLFLSFYLPLLGQFNPKCLKVESKGRSKIKLKHKARESASGGGPPGRLKDRGGCRASCQHARPLCGAGPASAHRMGLRKCSCQESEASLGSLKKVTQESAWGRWPVPHPTPHLLLISSRQGHFPTCTALRPQALRLCLVRGNHHVFTWPDSFLL